MLPGGARVGRRTLEWETRQRKKDSSARWQASWTPGGAWALKVPLAEKGGYIARKSNLLFFLNILHKTHAGTRFVLLELWGIQTEGRTPCVQLWSTAHWVDRQGWVDQCSQPRRGWKGRSQAGEWKQSYFQVLEEDDPPRSERKTLCLWRVEFWVTSLGY